MQHDRDPRFQNSSPIPPKDVDTSTLDYTTPIETVYMFIV